MAMEPEDTVCILKEAYESLYEEFKRDHDILTSMARDIMYLKEGVTTALANKTDKDELGAKTVLDHEKRVSTLENRFNEIYEGLRENKEDLSKAFEKMENKINSLNEIVEKLKAWKWQLAGAIGATVFLINVFFNLIKK